MFRAVFFAGVFFFCGAAFAQTWDMPDSVEVLSVQYRNARAKGENGAAIQILREIILILPEDSDWHMKLAEDLLEAGSAVEARGVFDRVLEIEPEFLKAAVGIARTYAAQKKYKKAKAEMLKAARKGYPVARMLRERGLKACFNDSRFVLELLEADKPEEVEVRDVFVNPLRRPEKGKKKNGEGDKPSKKLSVAEQKRIVEKAKANAAAAQEAIGRGEIEQALVFYNIIMECCKKKLLFTETDLIKELGVTREIAQDWLYPRIETLLRIKTIKKARDILDKLTLSVAERDKEKARGLNAELLGVVRGALESRDEQLKKRIRDIDKKRAEVFRTVEVLDEFDREIRPKLALRGTITGKLADGRPFAFIDVSSPDGVSRMVVEEGDKIDGLNEIRIVQIDEDFILMRYRGVEIRLELGGGIALATHVSPLRES